MSLTEILLSLAIMIAVVAGVAVNYTTVKDRNDEQQVMQSLQMLRANIEQIYGTNNYTGINNEVLAKAGAVPREILHGAADIKTRWGEVTVAALGTDSYTMTLINLPPSACRNLANLSTTSWSKVDVGETTLFSREENTDVTPSAILQACQGAGNTLVFTGP
ncbi:MAG: hypothetical protein K5657_07855 [Desulfovibrio sp.]|nr:hypothetical protein [Desulfovibrio sp.]